jgi:hypothetical protein
MLSKSNIVGKTIGTSFLNDKSQRNNPQSHQSRLKQLKKVWVANNSKKMLEHRI